MDRTKFYLGAFVVLILLTPLHQSSARTYDDAGFLDSLTCFLQSVLSQAPCIYTETDYVSADISDSITTLQMQANTHNTGGGLFDLFACLFKKTFAGDPCQNDISPLSETPQATQTTETSPEIQVYNLTSDPQFQSLRRAYEDLRDSINTQKPPASQVITKEVVVRELQPIIVPSPAVRNQAFSLLNLVPSLDCSELGSGGKLTTDANGNIICASDRRGGGPSTDDQTLSFDTGTYILSIEGGNTANLSVLANASVSTLEGLADVNSFAQSTGDLIFWNGSAWNNLATSSLNVALSDTTGSTDDITEGSTNLFSQWNTSGGDISFTAGNVGIGNPSPGYALDIYEDINATHGILIQNPNTGDSARSNILLRTDGLGMDFYAAGTGNTSTINGLSTADAVVLRTWSSAPASAMFLGHGGAAPIHLFNSDTVRMTVDAGGNVGIGTTIPSEKLTVNGNGVFGDITTKYNRLTLNGGHVGDGDNDYGLTINSYEPAITMLDRSVSAGSSQIRGHSNGAVWLLGDPSNDGTIGHATNTTDFVMAKFEPDSHIFYVDSGATEALRIDGDGNIGIGIINPSATLEVQPSANGKFAVGIENASSTDLGGLYVNGGGDGEFWLKDNTGTYQTRILTNGTSYLNGGNVGIGTTVPNGNLDISSESPSGLDGLVIYQSVDNVTTLQAYIDGNWANRTTYAGGCCNALALQPDVGSVGIGTASPSTQLHTTGGVRFATFGAGTLQTDASGNLSVSSDVRLKDVQGDFARSIEALLAIEPITYNWNEASGFDQSTLYAGFSAQNIRENIPEAVGENPNGFLTLSDRPIIATLVNAVKEIWDKLMGHDTRITELEREVSELKSLIGGHSQTAPGSDAGAANDNEPEMGIGDGFSEIPSTGTSSDENSTTTTQLIEDNNTSSEAIANTATGSSTPDQLIPESDNGLSQPPEVEPDATDLEETPKEEPIETSDTEITVEPALQEELGPELDDGDTVLEEAA